MKKLMIAAATAAMVGGAFAGLCDDDPAEATGCSVYDVKFTFKTLDAKLFTTKGSKPICGDETDGCKAVYLENATRTLNGIIWACEGSCDMLAAQPNFVLWEAKAKSAITSPLRWNGYSWEADVAEFDVLDRYGKKANKVQASWPIECDTVVISAAGFGSFDVKKELVKSVNGNAVAIFATPLTQKYAECGDPLVADLCTAFDNWCDDGTAADALVASGTWSIKYNASLSSGKKRLSQIVPKYAQE